MRRTDSPVARDPEFSRGSFFVRNSNESPASVIRVSYRSVAIFGFLGSFMLSCFAQSVGISPSYLPVVIGGGVACVVLVVLGIRMSLGTQLKRGRAKKRECETWEPPEGTGADRRTTVRREGQAVSVILNSAVFRNKSESAFVVDRSTGGLKIICSKPVTEGSTLQVRAENAPDNIPWVTVVVRSCRESDDRYELGCEFEKTPPWNVLLLFG